MMAENHEYDTYTISSHLRSFADANYGAHVRDIYVTLPNNPSGPHTAWILYHYPESGVAMEAIRDAFATYLTNTWGFALELDDWRVPES